MGALLLIFLVHFYPAFGTAGPTSSSDCGNLYDVKPVRFRCFAESYGPIKSVWLGSTLNVQRVGQTSGEREGSAAGCSPANDLIGPDYGPHYVKVRKVCTLEVFSSNRLRPIREE